MNRADEREQLLRGGTSDSTWRIRLDVSSGTFPRFDQNLEHGLEELQRVERRGRLQRPPPLTKDKLAQIAHLHLRGNSQSTFLYRFLTDLERIRIQRMIIL